MGSKRRNEIRDLVRTTSESLQKDPKVTRIKEIDVGLDISTSVVGVVLLDARTGSYEKMFAIRLTSTKFNDIWDKADHVNEVLEKELVFNMGPYSYKRIYVEANAMAYTKGLSSAATLFTLAKFNGIVSNDIRRMLAIKPRMINVRSARKQLGIKIDRKDKSKSNKDKIFDVVRSLNPNFPWEQHVAKTGKKKGQIVYSKHNQDLADAWVICRGGQIIEP
jgi:hypothetical protein